VVPSFAAEEGKLELEKWGYKGKIETASSSPAGSVPCLELPDGKILKGAKPVMGWLKEGAAGSLKDN